MESKTGLARVNQDAIEAERKSAALRYGLPADSTWEKINERAEYLVKQGISRQKKEMIGDLKAIDSTSKASLTGSINFMMDKLVDITLLTGQGKLAECGSDLTNYLNELHNMETQRRQLPTGAQNSINTLMGKLFGVVQAHIGYQNNQCGANLPGSFEVFQQWSADKRK